MSLELNPLRRITRLLSQSLPPGEEEAFSTSTSSVGDLDSLYDVSAPRTQQWQKPN
jgi:hypothetical protein